MNDDATINEQYGVKYAGMDRYEARKAIVEENGKYYIYKKEQDEYVLSPIETGFTDGENMEIISGLDKDETYYIAGVH